MNNSNSLTVNVKKLHEDAKLPTYGTDGAACFDLYALTEPSEVNLVSGNHSGAYRTGLSFEIPDGHVMLVFSRSGHGFKNGVRLANCTGVIDSDYRGELKVALRNDGEDIFLVQNGDRIAQAMILPYPKVTFNEVEELSDTSRGANGFGSTGK